MENNPLSNVSCIIISFFENIKQLCCYPIYLYILEYICHNYLSGFFKIFYSHFLLIIQTKFFGYLFSWIVFNVTLNQLNIATIGFP